eukprot:2098352-Rhodomonas_salina.2
MRLRLGWYRAYHQRYIHEKGEGQRQVASCLRACYAMSGTDLVHGAVSLRACYAMPCTGLAYGSIAVLTT